MNAIFCGGILSYFKQYYPEISSRELSDKICACRKTDEEVIFYTLKGSGSDESIVKCRAFWVDPSALHDESPLAEYLCIARDDFSYANVWCVLYDEVTAEIEWFLLDHDFNEHKCYIMGKDA